MVNLPTLHRIRDELCRAYFAKMKRSDHKMNALNGRSVSYALRLVQQFTYPKDKNLSLQKFFNSVVFRAFSDRLVMDMYFNRQFKLIELLYVLNLLLRFLMMIFILTRYSNIVH